VKYVISPDVKTLSLAVLKEGTEVFDYVTQVKAVIEVRDDRDNIVVDERFFDLSLPEDKIVGEYKRIWEFKVPEETRREIESWFKNVNINALKKELRKQRLRFEPEENTCSNIEEIVSEQTFDEED
jgi:hypothetical protein